MELLAQDLKFGARLLWKDKGFAITALATLALCIGANTAIFSVLHSVVLKPLPVPESNRILLMYNSYPNAGVVRASNSAADFYDRLRAVPAFEEQALYSFPGLTIGEKGAVERVQGMAVTPSFFRLLRVKPKLGRIFTEEEGEIGAERKVVLSYSLWQKLYGGDPSAVGKDLRISGNPYRIAGVLPEDFVYLRPDVRLWQPLAFTAERKTMRHSNNWEMIGRLKPDATLEQARSQIDALNAANLDLFPQFKRILLNAGFHTKVMPLQEEIVREIRKTLYLLWGGVLFVLLIGAVNIANLVMARSTIRMRELATRFALGAGRWRVTRQLLTESIVLTTCSAAVGILLGTWCLRALSTLGLDRIPRSSEISMDTTVVILMLGLAVAIGAAIGIIPVLHAARVDLTTVLHGEGRTGSGARGIRIWRSTLVAGQVAFALILLFGAGLLFASFREVLAVKPGFLPSGVLTASVALPAARYSGSPELRGFMTRALERIRAVPGVQSIGAIDTIPFGEDSSDSVILAEGYVMQPGESLISPNQMVVTPGYFETMRIPLIAGSLFEERDKEGAPKVIIIDERLARKFWPDSNPVGRRMWRPTSAEGLVNPEKNSEWFTVLGVVGSIKFRALVDPDERVGAYYFPYDQSPNSGMTFVLKTTVDAGSLIYPMRKVITELDAELPLYDVRTMQERIDESLITRRTPMLISVAFGAVALFLAAVGIYGVLAYMVAHRTKEIGIRIALGSSAEGIFGLVLKEGAVIIAAGLLVGIAGAMAISRYVGSVLYGIRPMDPTVLFSVTTVLVIMALLACILPARRATRIDPVIALRQE